MLEPMKTERIEGLYLPVKENALKFLEAANNRGFNIGIFEGFRSFDKQLTYFLQGRSTAGKIITNALPGRSFHQYALAIDVAFIDDSGNWSWDGPWSMVGEMGESFGFEWGGKWPLGDSAHFQMTFGKDINELYALFQSEGLKGVQNGLCG